MAWVLYPPIKKGRPAKTPTSLTEDEKMAAIKLLSGPKPIAKIDDSCLVVTTKIRDDFIDAS